MSSLQSRIARRAGVAQSTVSRALSNHPALPAATRRRIQTIARQLGYTPNPLVSSVFGAMRRRQGRTNLGTLAFLTAHATPDAWRSVPTYRDFFRGAQERAAEQGFALESHWAADPALSGRRLGEILEARGIRGLILSTRVQESGLPALAWDRFALVRIGLAQRTLPVYCAVNHQQRTIRQAAGELAARGYQRIGLTLTSWQNQAADENWLAGFLVWQESQPKRQRVPYHMPASLTAKAFLAWSRKHRPDALLAVNPDVLPWLRQSGSGAPADAGFALLDWHEHYGDFAGMDQNNPLAGAAAVDLLLAQIRRNEAGIPSHPHTVLIESTWRDGGSVRPRLTNPADAPTVNA